MIVYLSVTSLGCPRRATSQCRKLCSYISHMLMLTGAPSLPRPLPPTHRVKGHLLAFLMGRVCVSCQHM